MSELDDEMDVERQSVEIEADLFEVLIGDHRALRGLLEQMDQQIDDDPEGTRLLLPQVRALFLPHAHAEAKVLYTALEREPETAETAHEAREEHALVEYVLDQMSRARVVDDAWKAKLHVVMELIDLHVDEAEEHMFAQAREVFGPERLAELGEQFVDEKHREAARLGVSGRRNAAESGNATTVV